MNWYGLSVELPDQFKTWKPPTAWKIVEELDRATLHFTLLFGVKPSDHGAIDALVKEAACTSDDINWNVNPMYVQPEHTKLRGTGYWVVQPICPKVDALKKNLEKIFLPNVEHDIDLQVTLAVVERRPELEALFGSGCKIKVSTQ